MTEPIALQVEHVAIELIVEPFRQSGPFLRTMNISAQGCRVDASYFTHNRDTRRGRGRLIPSATGPKDLPTVLGLCEMSWKNVGKSTTGEGHKFFFSGKEN